MSKMMFIKGKGRILGKILIYCLIILHINMGMPLPLPDIFSFQKPQKTGKLTIESAFAEEPNNPPTIEQIDPITKDEGETISLEPVVTDPDGDPVTVTYEPPFDSDGSWQIPYDFTTPDPTKSFTTQIIASDGELTSSIDVNITVNNANVAPEVQMTLSSYSVNPNTDFTIYITASDPDGDTLTYKLIEGARTITVPASLEVVDSISSAGIYQYTITATDPGGESATDTCYIEIIDSSPGKDDVYPVSGDFNGDGLTDIGTFTKTTGEWKIALSDNGKFNNIESWITNFKGDNTDRTVSIAGDFNKDGLTDIGLYNNDGGKWKFAFSDGTQFIEDSSWNITYFGSGGRQSLTGDFNGDGVTDIGHYDVSNADGWIKLAKSDGTGFRQGATYFETNLSDSSAYAGDFDGDGLADILAFKKSSGEWRVMLSQDVLSHTVVNWATDTTNTKTAGGASEYEQGSAADGFDENESSFYRRSDFMDSQEENGAYAKAWIQSEFVSAHEITHMKAVFNCTDGWNEGGHPYKLEYFDGSWHTATSGGSSGSKQTIDLTDLDYTNVTKVKLTGEVEVWAAWEPALAEVYLYELYAWGPPPYTSEFNEGLSPFTTSTSWKTSFGSDKEPVLWDYNHDGKTDIGYFDKDTGKWYAALSDGTQFIEQSGEVWPSDFGAGDDNLASGGDFNGDGIGDAAIFHKTEHGLLNKWEIKLHNSKKPDLLTSIHNGIGGTTTIKYACSTAFDNTGVDDIPDLPFPINVVSEVTQEDGLGNSYKTRYIYWDGLFEANKREFRGFGYVRVIDAEGSIKETYFNQEDILKGRPEREVIKDKYERTYSEIIYNWDIREDIYSGLADFPHLVDKTSTAYNPNTSQSKSSQVFYTYDDYGNTANIKEEGFLDETDDEREASITYDYDTEKWILSKPSQSEIKNSAGTTVSATKYTYDSNGSLTKEEKWLGEVGSPPQWGTEQNPITEFGYDDYGNIETVKDANGNITQTTYDLTKTFPLSIRNQLGHTQALTYDNATGKIKTSTDPNGQITTSTYDSFGRPINVTGPGNISQTSYTYDLTVVPVKITATTKVNATSSITAYSFIDGLGRQVSSRIQAEYQGTPKHLVSSEVQYDSRGQIIKKYLPYYIDVPTPEDKYLSPSFSTPFISYEYDAIGRLIKAISPDNKASYVIYGVNTIESINENSQRTKQTKDAYGRLTEVQEADGSVTNYVYDVLGNLTDTYDSASPRNRTHIDYDTLGRKISMADPDMGGFAGKSWTYTYDKVGNLISQTDAKNQTINFEYDVLNRLISKSTGVTYVYDQGSNAVGRLSQVIDSSGTTEFFYDILGREIKTVKTINATPYTVERTFDSLDRLITVKYPDNAIISYTYNKQGGIKTITGSGGAVYVSSVEYNANGQIERVVYGNGASTDYEYDPYNFRLEHLKTLNPSLATIQELSYNFDLIGNVTSILDSKYTNTQHFEYDDINRLIYANGASYGQINYQYDSIGNMLQKGDIAMEYGGTAGPHAVTAYTLNSARYEISYDHNGNMIQKGSTAFEYDTENRLTKVTAQKGGRMFDISIDLTTGWNFFSIPGIVSDSNLQNVLSSIEGKYEQVSKYVTSEGKWKHYVGNDKFNQFNTVSYGEGYLIYVTQNCALDITGNFPLTQRTRDLKTGWNLINAPTDFDIDTAEALEGITYDKVAEYNGTGYTYNPPTLKKGKAYWVHINSDQIWNIPLPKVEAIYTYDGDSGRVIRQTNDKANIYISSSFELEGIPGEPADIITKHIFMGNTRICSIEDTTEGVHTYYYHQDHIGSSNVITDEAAEVVNILEYTPYGGVSRNTGDYSTDKRFTGKTWDSSAMLYYFGARYYDPQLGRFITPDTIIQHPYDPQDFNRYAYARNNPVKYIDPTGHSWLSKLWHKVEDFFEDSWEYVVSAAIIVSTLFLATINPVAAAPFFYGEFIGATAGGISAFQQGGDVGQGVLFGTIAGGMTGGLSMGFKDYMLGTAYAGVKISAFEGGLITAGEFAIGGFGMGLIEGYAGGARDWDDAFSYALRGAAIGAGIGFAAGYSYTAGWQGFMHGADTQAHNRSVLERMKNGLKVSFTNAIEKYREYIARMDQFYKSKTGRFIKSVIGAKGAVKPGGFTLDPELAENWAEYIREQQRRKILNGYGYRG